MLETRVVVAEAIGPHRGLETEARMSNEATAALQKSRPTRPGLHVLVVGPETEAEFDYARKVEAGGGRATCINPVKSPAAARFELHGGTFVQGKIQQLPDDACFDIIREDFPYPTGNYIDFPAVQARLSRLKPGGSWVVVTEKPDFASTLEVAAQHGGASVLRREFPFAHDGAPVSLHPRDKSRIALVISR